MKGMLYEYYDGAGRRYIVFSDGLKCSPKEVSNMKYYTLYYQKRYGNTAFIARSKSLLKLLKIKLVTYGFDMRAFVASGTEQFNKFDLSDDERVRFNDFEMRVNSGRYFPTYDYRQRARKRAY